jgi:hypothetical protein
VNIPITPGSAFKMWTDIFRDLKGINIFCGLKIVKILVVFRPNG